MRDTIIILLIATIVIYLFIELDNLAQKIRIKMMFPYDPSEYNDEKDFVGFPLMSSRDFSGDDDNARTIIIGKDNPRFSDAQKKVLGITKKGDILSRAKKGVPTARLVEPTRKVKPTKKSKSKAIVKVEDIPPVKVEDEPIEDVEFEFGTAKAVKNVTSSK